MHSLRRDRLWDFCRNELNGRRHCSTGGQLRGVCGLWGFWPALDWTLGLVGGTDVMSDLGDQHVSFAATTEHRFLAVVVALLGTRSLALAVVVYLRLASNHRRDQTCSDK